ncbi:MAG: N-6 DNA methylase [Candidatus Limnocylindrales bacterium]
MSAPGEVLELIDRYLQQRTAYEAGHYNETTLRREFIDPLFRLLGWDVDNRVGRPEAFKDVVHEDAVRVAGSSKAPDYAFRVGGVRKFFVEAKRPALNVREDAAWAFQLRRYSWSAALPLGILTNFRDFAVYDTRIQPAKDDRATVARVMLLTCEEYSDHWAELEGIFSRSAAYDGRLDAFAARAPTAKGTLPVDDAFLSDIDRWRAELAGELRSTAPSLRPRELNYAVQATIDRIVFLRMCEDRGLEPFGALRDAASRSDIYTRLCELFLRADGRYDSGLFHFAREHGRGGEPDGLTLKLRFGDDVLRRIMARLYEPESPYEFSVLGADILGHVYERYLGKVIVIDDQGRAVVETKPEVRRAGGVYYTPTYIVKFLVDHAVGGSLRGKTPEMLLGGRKSRGFRVVDPACGSGSFLIEAYQHLLDWYLGCYVANDPAHWARTKSPRVFPDARGLWRLTTTERKRILTEHIFGVDIDPQAVEVTKLSLLLKVLEGESGETIQQELRLFNERALPDLDENIRCGNSLVGPDLYEQVQMDLFSSDELERTNAFDWRQEFPEAFVEGGFDAVIGNPPYVYRNATQARLRTYFEHHFSSAEGNYELYKFFIEQGLRLLRPGGRLGYIASASFLVQPSFEKLRSLLLTSTVLEQLAPLGPGAFKSATVDTCLLVVANSTAGPDHELEIRAPATAADLPTTKPHRVPQARFSGNPGRVFDYRLDEPQAALVSRLLKSLPPLEEGFEFGVGINTGFIRDELVADHELDERYHRLVTGSGISRYGPVRTDGWVMYDSDFVKGRGDRGRSLPAERFLASDKILVVRTRNLSLKRRIVATLDVTGAYNLNRLSNIIARPDRSLLGLLGILNSALFNWLFSTRWFDYEIKPVYLRRAPLADTEDPALDTAVRRMLELVATLGQVSTTQEATRVARLVEATDAEIDRHVFRLYGLGEDEAQMIEAQRPKDRNQHPR